MTQTVYGEPWRRTPYATKSLEARKAQVLAYIQNYRYQHGHVPTIREIQQACDVSSTSVVRYTLLALQQDGHLTGLPEPGQGARGSRARAYQLVDGGQSFVTPAGMRVALPPSVQFSPERLPMVAAWLDMTLKKCREDFGV